MFFHRLWSRWFVTNLINALPGIAASIGSKTFPAGNNFWPWLLASYAFVRVLRDIVVCLNAQQDKLYHLGFRSLMTMSTLARANEKRDWRIYRDYAQMLITEARKLYVKDKIFNLQLDGTVYVIDSTTIELCLNLFPWAKLKKVRAAVKLNLALELKGNIPAFFQISEGKTHDIHFLDFLEFEAGAYYIMDRGYVDFGRLYKIHKSDAFFVTRAKDNFSFKRLYSNPVDRSTGVICDQVVTPAGLQGRQRLSGEVKKN